MGRGESQVLLVGRGGVRKRPEVILEGDVLIDKEGEIIGAQITSPDPKSAESMAAAWPKLESACGEEIAAQLRPLANTKSAPVRVREVKEALLLIRRVKNTAQDEFTQTMCVMSTNLLEKALQETEDKIRAAR